MKNSAKILLVLIFLMSNQALLWAVSNSSDLEFKNPFVPMTPKKKEERPAAPQTPQLPVQPIQQAPVVPPSLIITGLVWGSARPQAIIENTVVDVGDEIKGVKITGINQSGINFLYQDKYFTVTIDQNTARLFTDVQNDGRM